jgi:hypothetical protein
MDINPTVWPEPDPEHGDGSDFAESEENDGTPGAVK